MQSTHLQPPSALESHTWAPGRQLLSFPFHSFPIELGLWRCLLCRRYESGDWRKERLELCFPTLSLPLEFEHLPTTMASTRPLWPRPPCPGLGVVLSAITTFFLTFIFIYFLGCARSWLWHTGSLIFIAIYRIFSCSNWDLVPWPGIEPGSSALGAQSLRHCTRKFLLLLLLLIFTRGPLHP